MKDKIAIVSMASISALGTAPDTIWKNYLTDRATFKHSSFDNFEALVSNIDAENWKTVNQLKENSHYKDLDPSVLMAIEVSRQAIAGTDWKGKEFGINIGSSRGATHLFEKYHQEFLTSSLGTVSTLSSPTTTLGNISSWVGHDLQVQGPTISHSIACSTSLHALLNGMAWIKGGMSKRFLVGGTEASNTPFTIAQMKALKIYSGETGKYPCRTLDKKKKKNTMILGEGAAVFCLEKNCEQKSLAIIQGVGFATEVLKHNISISTDAKCFQRSMKMAIADAELETHEIDIIITHAPGTIKGDKSEMNAIEQVFENQLPVCTSNKWKIGHLLGASGALSLEMAILMLQQQQFVPIPFLDDQYLPKQIQYIMVNSVGFGGNAVSIILSKL